jgi:hypothetical protein
LTIDEFMVVVRPELEHQLDQMILAQPADDRPFLMRNRERMLRELVHVTEIANLRHRLEQAEARLSRLRVVE